MNSGGPWTTAAYISSGISGWVSKNFWKDSAAVGTSRLPTCRRRPAAAASTAYCSLAFWRPRSGQSISAMSPSHALARSAFAPAASQRSPREAAKWRRNQGSWRSLDVDDGHSRTRPARAHLEAAPGIEPGCRDLQSLASTTRPRRQERRTLSVGAAGRDRARRWFDPRRRPLRGGVFGLRCGTGSAHVRCPGP